MEYWLQTDDINSFRYLLDFYDAGKYLIDSEKLQFTPYYSAWSCNGCQQDSQVFKSCISNGKYCAKHNFDSGKELIMETLRQVCIHKTDQNKWFAYLNKMIRNSNDCIKERSAEKLKECSLTAMKENGIDSQGIESCVEKSFFEPGNLESDNYLLRKFRELAENRGVTYTPYIQINGDEYIVE